MNLEIREAQPGDKDAIRTLLEQAALPTETVDQGPTVFYIGWTKGSIAGVAGLEFYGTEAVLRSVAITPELRGNGLGARFVDFMIARAKQRGVKHLFLLTEGAEGFFRRIGFRPVDRSAITNAALTRSSEFASVCPASAVCMQLDLTSLVV